MNHLNKTLFSAVVLLGAGGVFPAAAQENPVRPPATPLVTHDPYFCVWSTADRLTDDWSRHWTGAVQAMVGMVRIDGKPYRFCGIQPNTVPAMAQVKRDVQATRTLYGFEAGGIRLDLTFTSPVLPEDLDLVSRPVTYVTWDARATDGKRHRVSLYLDCTGEWAVNTPEQAVQWDRMPTRGLSVLRIGTKEQPVLQKRGDNLRIDWGHLLVALPGKGRQVVVSDRVARDGFAERGELPAADDTRMPRPARDEWPVLATTLDLGAVGASPVSRHLLLAYDDDYGIQYFGKNLRPWWKRKGMSSAALLEQAERDYSRLQKRCARFDRELWRDLERAGGPKYAALSALSYRQCMSAHKLVAGADGAPLMFPKENFSNGCIGTVDVIYPSSPFFLLLNPTLLKAQVTPVLDYGRSERWKFPFAPHDLGQYPQANGQVYGGGERTEENQMPVEECGNMLLMVAALAKVDGNAEYARPYWPELRTWAKYLRDKGLDPENQLCTDDFAGHLAHNTNLSVKAIEALGGYALLCEMLGGADEAADYRRAAGGMARQWMRMADDGDHYRLTFDKSGTWSQKYNLVWDRLLGINLFPAAVARKELAYYRTQLQPYGLPLDNRKAYTKLDWEVWTATLSERPEEFRGIVDTLYAFADKTPSRVPLTDWYWTGDAKQVGFQARSVVGGVYIKLLADPETWRSWSSRGARRD